MIKIGIVTDIHYNKQVQYGSRYLPDSLPKLAEALIHFTREKVDFCLNLGDSIDCRGLAGLDEISLARLQRLLAGFALPFFHLAGNHDLEWLTKEEFARSFAQKESAPASFDLAGLHLILLDAGFSQAGEETHGLAWDWRETYLPQQQLDWLEKDLAGTDQPLVLVCVHQNLDERLTEDGQLDPHCVRNAAQVRQILEKSHKKIIVLQGHYHPGFYQKQNGIDYVTFAAMCEGPGLVNNSYAILTISDDEISVSGFGAQASYSLLSSQA